MGTSIWAVELWMFLVFNFIFSVTHHVSLGANPNGDSLSCGKESLSYTVSNDLRKSASIRIGAIDEQGVRRLLSLHSVCGARLCINPDASLTITASYNGCFVHRQGSGYVMTLFTEMADFAEKDGIPDIKVLWCPMSEEGSLGNLTSHIRNLSTSQNPIFFPAVNGSNKISIKGSPILPKPLDKEWVRMTIVAGVLVFLVTTMCLLKKCKSAPVKV